MKYAFLLFTLTLFIMGGTSHAMSKLPFGGDHYSWRYKIIVEIETPEGVKSGEAVREVSVTLNNNTGDALKRSLRGEAVVVDLGERGILFALLKGAKGDTDYSYNVIQQIPAAKGHLTPEGAKYLSELKDMAVQLEPDHYPMLVTFTDINNPQTIEPVLMMGENQILNDRFNELFGEGVFIKSITMQMTDENVNFNIGDLISWLPSRANKKGYIGAPDESPFKDPSKTYLNGTEFSQGQFWLK